MINTTVHCPSDQPGVYHIPGFHNTQVTLCGFVDCNNDAHQSDEHPCNYAACISALKKIKAAKFCRGYFAL